MTKSVKGNEEHEKMTWGMFFEFILMMSLTLLGLWFFTSLLVRLFEFGV